MAREPLLAKKVPPKVSSPGAQDTGSPNATQTVARVAELSSLDIKLGLTMQVLQSRLSYEYGLIFLTDSRNKQLVYRAGYGYSDEERALLGPLTLPLVQPESLAQSGLESPIVACFRRGQSALIADAFKGVVVDSGSTTTSLGAEEMFVCPIVYEEISLGVLLVGNNKSKRPLIQTDINLLSGIAPAIGIAIHDSMLEEAKTSAELLASTDALTEVSNRRSGEQSLEREFAFATQKGHPLSCLVVDVDHFKKVNDIHGHAAGDEVLKAVAEVLRSCVRDSDTLARWGGEEFMLLLPKTAADGAARVAERILTRLVARRFEALADLRVTASIGIATGPGGGRAGSLVAAADKAMYRAKTNGRNRMEVAVMDEDS